jgi:hypothetical protein
MPSVDEHGLLLSSCVIWLLDGASDQYIGPERGEGGGDQSARAMEQANVCQFPHRSLDCVVFAKVVGLHVELPRQLQDRELGRMEHKRPRENETFDPPVVLSRRQSALLDIVVVHGS